MTLQDTIAALQAENAELRSQVRRLHAQAAELEEEGERLLVNARLNSALVRDQATEIESLSEQGQSFKQWGAEQSMLAESYRAVMRQALEALGPSAPECSGCAYEWQQAVNALREALEEQA